MADEPDTTKYPKVKYSKDGSKRVVQSGEEEQALEGEWGDRPKWWEGVSETVRTPRGARP
jgi:hypothetical protein